VIICSRSIYGFCDHWPRRGLNRPGAPAPEHGGVQRPGGRRGAARWTEAPPGRALHPGYSVASWCSQQEFPPAWNRMTTRWS